MELHIELISCIVVSLDVTIKKSSMYIRSTDSVFWHNLMRVFKKIRCRRKKILLLKVEIKWMQHQMRDLIYFILTTEFTRSLSECHMHEFRNFWLKFTQLQNLLHLGKISPYSRVVIFIKCRFCNCSTCTIFINFYVKLSCFIMARYCRHE